MSPGRPARRRFRFAVDLRFELFYSLELLSDPEASLHRAWQSRARRRLAAVDADALQATVPLAHVLLADALGALPPVSEYETLRDAFAGLPAARLLERVLEGVLHDGRAAARVAGGEVTLGEAVAAAPRAKREWLAHVGLYPFDECSPLAGWLGEVVADPERAQREALARMDTYHRRCFAETWSRLRPQLARSAASLERLFHGCDFAEFFPRSLLRVELDEGKGVLRALRGGYELAIDRVETFWVTPSTFNRHRYWTSLETEGGAWVAFLPAFDPELSPDGTGPALPDAGRPDTPVPTAPSETPDAHAIPGAAPEERDVTLVFKALGDTTRFALASLIARESLSSAELAQRLGVSRPTISHHLFLLRQAGLIEEETRGRSTYLRLRREPFRQLSALALRRFFPSTEEPS